MDLVLISEKIALTQMRGKARHTDRCIFLSEHFEHLTFLQKKVRVETLGNRFHELFQKHLHSLLELSHHLNEKHPDDFVYWGSQLASRSASAFPFFRHLIYFIAARELIQEHLQDRPDQRLVFIVESPALLHLLARAESAHSPTVFTHRPSPKILHTKWFLKSLQFLSQRMWTWFWVRFYRLKKMSKTISGRRYILRTWYTRGCLQATSSRPQYRNRNFGPLADFLRSQGHEAWTLPMMFNTDRSLRQELRLMKQSGETFLIPEHYLSPLDFFRALRNGLRQALLPIPQTFFHNQDVTELLREAHDQNAFYTELLNLNSVTLLLQRLKKKRYPLNAIAYPFENNQPEKLLILATKKYYPEATLLAFQHTVWLKEQTAHQLLPEEKKYFPLPHKIIYSGKRYRSILQDCGFGEELLLAGPNLRYTEVNTMTAGAEAHLSSSGKNRILVILNFSMSVSQEVFYKLAKALLTLERPYQLIIKAHPLNQRDQLERYLRARDLNHFEFVEGRVQKHILESDVVIMPAASVTNLETLALGKPLIRVSTDNTFDFDPLWEDYPLGNFARTPEEIRSQLIKAFTLEEDKKRELVQFGKSIVTDYFEPVTEQNMDVFLNL